MSIDNQYIVNHHTFAICAYKQSSYLEECILSLINQSLKSKIIICTSTPNDHILDLAKKYDLIVFINPEKKGIASDWNFAYSECNTDLVTICHQDDVYYQNYLKKVLKCLNKSRHPLIAFTDYSEIKRNSIIKCNLNLAIKRILLVPIMLLRNSTFTKRLILSFGDPICCPSVTYVRPNLKEPVFLDGFKTNLDWDAWERMSNLQGAFIYCHEILVSHRIHENSETSLAINDNLRSSEDYIIFKRFWNDPIAKILTKLYSKSEKNNEL